MIHQAGGYTSCSDKHPAYSSVGGPGDGTNVDDYYSPEINSTVVNLPGVTTPTGMSCATIPDPSETGSWTDSFQNIQCYDTLKVNAILNEIDGKTHRAHGRLVQTFPDVHRLEVHAEKCRHLRRRAHVCLTSNLVQQRLHFQSVVALDV